MTFRATPKFADLHSLSEDDRIDAIGRRAALGFVVGVVLERDEPEKIERYIRKVTDRFPSVTMLKRIEGPTPLVITLQFAKRTDLDS